MVEEMLSGGGWGWEAVLTEHAQARGTASAAGASTAGALPAHPQPQVPFSARAVYCPVADHARRCDRRDRGGVEELGGRAGRRGGGDGEDERGAVV
eukprot:1628021-Rhodomonas_salina.1